MKVPVMASIAPRLRITADIPVQHASAALVAASRHADLVVVGNRDLGVFAAGCPAW
jgi:hypothetical protein